MAKGEYMKKIKTLGIIGGLGPETTARFYMEVVFACSKISRRRPQILISNVAVPLSVEKELITEAKNMEDILPFLLNAAEQLEKGGADFIVIPCNTVHIFIEEIRESVNIPVLNIIEESSKFLKKKKIKQIGLFATTATINNKLFDKTLKNNDIEIQIPNASDQRRLVQIIHNLVNNKNKAEDKRKFLNIIQQTGVRNILLACTDLQILNPQIDGIRIFDTMDILAKAAVREVLK